MAAQNVKTMVRLKKWIYPIIVFLYILPCIGAVTHYRLPMDLRVGTTLMNPSGLDAKAIGNPEMVPGILGKAIRVNGKDTYVQVTGPGHRYECFGDLDKCPLGNTVVTSRE